MTQLIAIVITVCAISNPKQCVERELQVAGINELTCLTQGQGEVANYMRNFPGWKVTRFGCRRV